MCIAILSEYGVPLPSKTVMKRCFKNNSDGIGYAYLTVKDEWQVHKGFQKWNKFIDAFEAEKFKDEHTVIVHFRVGTSGKMLDPLTQHPDCTHPFPVSADEKELMAHDYVTKNVIMHNGVVGHPLGDMSDTMESIRDYAAVIVPYFDDPKMRNLLAELLQSENVGKHKGSRWFLALGTNYYMMGDWICDEKTKIWYSNDGYKPVIWKQTTRFMTPSTGVYGNWGMTGKEENIVDLAVLENRHAYEFMSACKWSWNKFDSDIAVAATGVTLLEKPKDDVRSLYDNSGNIIAMVDSDGDVVWDDIQEDTPPQTPGAKDCPECGGLLLSASIHEGMCPWCHSLVSPVSESQDKVECPGCKERNHLMDSSFDLGDTECLRCGALFVDTIVGKEAILGWNQDTKTAHEGLMTLAMGGEILS